MMKQMLPNTEKNINVTTDENWIWREIMTLYEYIKSAPDGEEIAVHDQDYDMESYFYNDDVDGDVWQEDMLKLARLLTVIESDGNHVTVNFSNLIVKKLDKLEAANLFIRCNTNAIMNDIDNILAGYVSEEWLTRFVKVLS
jgi:hypothetical protein